ncbi:hypothetical protein [Oceanobacillus chungangensis]|uniref:Lipoprotein n=1 Tax=Oceanobacillus chungangensis TaxID=1229152 RepID=A0A3D8PKX6_9BACI|nr:hypothetical protein [Oceanobacillus chungangensis]RDW15878.1 hypothetical protein CWR45_16135 [Oceanobacillus chungangensis]
MKGGILLLPKNYFFITMIFSILLILTGCSESNTDNSSADWAFSFVVWNGYIYQLSDEYVEDAGKEIGEVTNYSDTEGTYSGNFSNEYEKGTKYYSIEGISTDEVIAIEDNGKYRKAIRNEKYEEK